MFTKYAVIGCWSGCGSYKNWKIIVAFKEGRGDLFKLKKFAKNLECII